MVSVLFNLVPYAGIIQPHTHETDTHFQEGKRLNKKENRLMHLNGVFHVHFYLLWWLTGCPILRLCLVDYRSNSDSQTLSWLTISVMMYVTVKKQNVGMLTRSKMWYSSEASFKRHSRHDERSDFIKMLIDNHAYFMLAAENRLWIPLMELGGVTSSTDKKDCDDEECYQFGGHCGHIKQRSHKIPLWSPVENNRGWELGHV